MKDNQNNLYGLFEQVSTQQLDGMLHAELQKEQVDGDAVRVILRVLRERESGVPVEVDEATEQAWQKYLRDTSALQASVRMRSWVLRAAAMAAVLCVVLLMGPLSANAEGFYDLLVRWTDSVMEFFDPNDKNTNSVEYEFKTDNPGLQQVYDTVVELGVTDPVVPMWLPEGYELVECKINDSSRKKGVAATFLDDSSYLVFQMDAYDCGTSRSYHKDDGSAVTHEINGITHTILQNEGRWTVIWSYEYVECFIGMECQEEILYEILESIYGMEDD